MRPAGAFLMLDQQKEDTGSASALINCAGLVLEQPGEGSGGDQPSGRGGLSRRLAGWMMIGKGGGIRE
ncbi:MAG: hypothetical protein AB7D01_05250 [Methanoculleus sp.]